MGGDPGETRTPDTRFRKAPGKTAKESFREYKSALAGGTPRPADISFDISSDLRFTITGDPDGWYRRSTRSPTSSQSRMRRTMALLVGLRIRNAGTVADIVRSLAHSLHSVSMWSADMDWARPTYPSSVPGRSAGGMVARTASHERSTSLLAVVD